MILGSPKVELGGDLSRRPKKRRGTSRHLHTMQQALREMGPVVPDAAGPDEPRRRLRLVRVARGLIPITARPPSLRERRKGGRLGSHSQAGRTPSSRKNSVLRSATRRSLLEHNGRLTDRCTSAGANASSDHLGRRARLIAARLRHSTTRIAPLLHKWAREQRSSVRVPTYGSAVRTNNLPDCSNMAHESAAQRSPRRSVSARAPSVSTTSPTKPTSSDRRAEPGTNHPRMSPHSSTQRNVARESSASTRCPKPD